MRVHLFLFSRIGLSFILRFFSCSMSSQHKVYQNFYLSPSIHLQNFHFLVFSGVGNVLAHMNYYNVLNSQLHQHLPHLVILVIQLLPSQQVFHQYCNFYFINFSMPQKVIIFISYYFQLIPFQVNLWKHYLMKHLLQVYQKRYFMINQLNQYYFFELKVLLHHHEF